MTSRRTQVDAEEIVAGAHHHHHRWKSDRVAVHPVRCRMNFTVASTPDGDRQTGEWKDGEALFLRCNVWREAAENVAELTRGHESR